MGRKTNNKTNNPSVHIFKDMMDHYYNSIWTTEQGNKNYNTFANQLVSFVPFPLFRTRSIVDSKASNGMTTTSSHKSKPLARFGNQAFPMNKWLVLLSSHHSAWRSTSQLFILFKKRKKEEATESCVFCRLFQTAQSSRSLVQRTCLWVMRRAVSGLESIFFASFLHPPPPRSPFPWAPPRPPPSPTYSSPIVHFFF